MARASRAYADFENRSKSMPAAIGRRSNDVHVESRRKIGRRLTFRIAAWHFEATVTFGEYTGQAHLESWYRSAFERMKARLILR
ncbi:MAG: hypothetical protein R3E58_03435 [Phycisphaerae bacterium]